MQANSIEYARQRWFRPSQTLQFDLSRLPRPSCEAILGELPRGVVYLFVFEVPVHRVRYFTPFFPGIAFRSSRRAEGV